MARKKNSSVSGQKQFFWNKRHVLCMPTKTNLLYTMSLDCDLNFTYILSSFKQFMCLTHRTCFLRSPVWATEKTFWLGDIGKHHVFNGCINWSIRFVTYAYIKRSAV